MRLRQIGVRVATILVFAAIGLLTISCGESEGSDDSAPADDDEVAARSVLRAAGRVEGELRVTLMVEPEVIAGTNTRAWLLIEPTVGSEAAVRTVSGCCPFDFFVARDGVVVWRWFSGSRTKDASIGSQAFSVQQPLMYVVTWPVVDFEGDPLPPGRYAVTGRFETVDAATLKEQINYESGEVDIAVLPADDGSP